MDTILDVLNQFNVDYDNVETAPYRYGFKELIFPELLKTKEFNGVKKYKLIEFPIHTDTVDDLVNKDYSLEEIMRGDNYKTYVAESYNYNPAEEIIEFSDYIQIYDIRLAGKKYKQDDLPNGIWMYPGEFHPFNFTPSKTLEIKYDPAVFQDLFAIKGDDFKRELTDKIFSLIESGVSNIPYDQVISIRCLPNSIKKITKKQKTNK